MKKRSITVAGHRTSITLEEAFWVELKHCADREKKTVSQLVTDIDAARDLKTNLSSALRLHVLQTLKNAGN